MARNTFFLIVVLGIIAAIVVGINIGRTNTPPQNEQEGTLIDTPNATPTPNLVTYNATTCPVRFQYNDTYTEVDLDSGGSTFINLEDTKDKLTLICQKDLDQPKEFDDALAYSIGSSSARLIQPIASTSGQTVGRLYIKDEGSGMGIIVSGSRGIFNQFLDSLQLAE